MVGGSNSVGLEVVQVVEGEGKEPERGGKRQGGEVVMDTVTYQISSPEDWNE